MKLDKPLHCVSCTQVLMKNVDFEGEVLEFDTICPHCRKANHIKARKFVVFEISGKLFLAGLNNLDIIKLKEDYQNIRIL